MKKQSFKSIFLKIAILVLFIGIAIYLMKDSLHEIILEVSHTPFSIIGGISLLGILFYVLEGASFTLLSKRYEKKFSWLQGIGCAYYVNFFRVVTFGSGTVASNMIYLNRYQVPPSKSIGLITLHNIFYQVAVVFWAFVAFITQYDLIQTTFGNYFQYLLWGCLGAFIFISGMLLFALSANFHHLIMKIARFIFRSEKWQDKLKQVDEMFVTARSETRHLIHNWKILFSLFLIHSLRMISCYMIPLILFAPTTFKQAFVLVALMAVVLAIAGVIPSPAGIGGLEFVYLTFFSVVVGGVKAASTLLLYRFATYILPLVISACVMIYSEAKVKKIHESASK